MFVKSGLSQRVRASSEAGNGAAKTCRYYICWYISSSQSNIRWHRNLFTCL